MSIQIQTLWSFVNFRNKNLIDMQCLFHCQFDSQCELLLCFIGLPKNQSLSVIFIFKVNLQGNNPKLKIKSLKLKRFHVK